MTAKPLLFVADDDINFLELLERLKEAFSIELVVESNPQKAVERLNSPDFNPQGIVLSQTYLSNSLTGLDIYNTIEKKRTPKPILALILDKETIDVRLEAMQKGCEYIFSKPVSAYALLRSMSEALEVKPEAPLKVLVLDDDIDFCDYVSFVLAEIGVSTFAIYEATDLFKKLDELKPDILLLDVILPKYDGVHLLKTLRQDINYRNIIIVIVTGSARSNTRINAYEANVDDILFKPIDKDILQKRILSIADRMVAEKKPADHYIGLLHLKELTNELNYIIKSGRPEFYLAVFELHNIAEWTKQHGYISERELMVYISNQLQWEADHKMRCYLYKTSIFAIIFEGLELDIIENKLYKFLTHIVHEKSTLHLSFDCGVVSVSKNFGDGLKVLQDAEESLSEASWKEAAPVKIVHHLAKDEQEVKKEVLIIDPDRELLKILKKAFESHGILVRTYVEGSDALKDLLASSENNLPSLIISERKLPDMDGIDVFLKLKTRFRKRIPFFILTVFSSDKDISEGIKHGVLEYIVKPFNISILIQKALHALFKT